MDDHHIEQAWQFYRKLGSPKFICAPMVDQSELAFRMLTRKYGTTLAYTPMLNSKIMVESKTFKDEFFTTCPEDRPLFAQLCGHNPQILIKAALMIQDECDAIDINLGCPQGIARKGLYGSYLLEKRELVLTIVKELKQNINIPVTCKIRIFKDIKRTLDLTKDIQQSGCSILTVHGRTKEQNKDLVGQCDWNIIAQIKQLLQIPVFANGGIYTWSDVERCLQETKADAVMSSEALLENPALFSGQIKDLNELAIEYMQFAKQYNAKLPEIKAHLFKLLYTSLQVHTDLRSKLGSAKTYDQHLDIVIQLNRLRAHIPLENKFGWYKRYQNFKQPQPKDKDIQKLENIIKQQDLSLQNNNQE
ncbi:unnamed protein product [Paramecium sonneborni]|uniref:DUS-like FMN-binding domain-containing protein n=1 Tax=Paramecium sonneborni TaxID=65129 RepID=A0A8S1Q6H3_9CILI|nr:unnamed protein product [Paramecium sonneborni]